MADVVSLQFASQSLLDEAGVQIHLPSVLVLSRVIASLGWKTAALHVISHESQATEVTQWSRVPDRSCRADTRPQATPSNTRWAEQILLLLKPSFTCMPQVLQSFYPRVELSCSPLHPQSLSHTGPETKDMHTHLYPHHTVPQLWVPFPVAPSATSFCRSCCFGLSPPVSSSQRSEVPTMKSVRKEDGHVGRRRQWVGEVRMKEGRIEGMSWNTENDTPQACSAVSMCPGAMVLCFLD